MDHLLQLKNTADWHSIETPGNKGMINSGCQPSNTTVDQCQNEVASSLAAGLVTPMSPLH